ncbi:unnamed protein product [marine sediment metagenome]|uniref:Uncharacterized protein n=1 Tax=marine sediment metagenome TaxID=412755 RepID=X1SEC3_9ZZZZ
MSAPRKEVVRKVKPEDCPRATRRVFELSGNNKGLMCPFKPTTLCQEGYCSECQIYLDWQKLKEKVVICGSCGKVMYRISDFGRSVLFLGLCDECDKEGGSEKGET